MKRSTKITIVTILFFLVQAFVTVCSLKLCAEPVKTSETTFILTEDDPTVEYKVAKNKDCVYVTMLAVKADEDILISEFIPDEVLEGMKLINAECATFAYKNVEVYFYNGRTYFIIHN